MIRFYSPYLLAGLIATAIPLLIFLMTRDTIKKVTFSTLRFFAGASSTLIKRKRWQEALLLAMRMAICALLAVAFARPFFAKREDPQGDKLRAGKAVALVVDVSASMGQRGAFEQAQTLMGRAIKELPEDAVMTLVAFDRTPRVEVPWTREAAKIKDSATALTPGAGGTDLAAAIRKADEALEQVAAEEKEIVLVSDMPRSGWEGFVGNWKLHPGVKLRVEQVSPGQRVGMAIVAADYPQGIVADGTARPVTVRVAGFTDEPMRDVPVRLTVAGRDIATQTVQVPANGSVVARFMHTFEQAGDNPGVVEIGPKGNGGFGSKLYFNTRVLPKINVVIVADEGAGKRNEALFFLQTALAPAPESPFVTKVVSPVNAALGDFAAADVVAVVDVDRVTHEVQGALSGILKRGGGLLFLPGSKTNAETFSTTFGELAPCKLRRIMVASESRRGDAKAVLTKINFEHPIMELFQRPHFGNFSAVTFDRYWEVTSSQLAKVLARFDDGRPFLLERGIEQGSTALLASPPDPTWNNLPDRAIFLPLVHQVTRHLAQRTEPATAYTVGEYLPIPPGSSLKSPTGNTHQGTSFLADTIGYFTLMDDSGHAIRTYAVNGDMGEVNPVAIDAGEVRAAVEVEKPATGAAQAAGSFVARAGKEIWVYLVAALLLLTISELFVANRVARH